YFIDVMHPNQSTHVSQLRQAQGSGATTLEVTVMSFGYKEGPPPLTNMVFDVRFLKNPFWIPDLLPLIGLYQPGQDYAVKQALAREFLDSLLILLNSVLPRFAELELTDFSIAFGCTGGQHRSVAIVEALAQRIAAAFPHFKVVRRHRELRADGSEVPAGFRDEAGIAIETRLPVDRVQEPEGSWHAPATDKRDSMGDGGD